jgi:hypothetical protein
MKSYLLVLILSSISILSTFGFRLPDAPDQQCAFDVREEDKQSPGPEPGPEPDEDLKAWQKCEALCLEFFRDRKIFIPTRKSDEDNCHDICSPIKRSYPGILWDESVKSLCKMKIDPACLYKCATAFPKYPDKEVDR